MGASSQIRVDWETNGTAIAAGAQSILIADTTAYFVVGAGRQIRIEL
jgi:hypothetical protein